MKEINPLTSLRALAALLVLTNAFCAVMYLIWEVPARRFIVNRWGGHR